MLARIRSSVLCHCGCGEYTFIHNILRTPNIYIYRHKRILTDEDKVKKSTAAFLRWQRNPMSIETKKRISDKIKVLHQKGYYKPFYKTRVLSEQGRKSIAK